jgi:Leucine-rich repeat (LRR) protein
MAHDKVTKPEGSDDANSGIEKLGTKAFFDLPNAKIIYINGSQISSINKHAFANLPNLEAVYLYDNLIQNISAEAFYNLPKLSKVYLKGNRINFIAAGAFKRCSALQHFSYDGDAENDIQCGSPDGYLECPIVDLSFNPIITELDTFGNAIYPAAVDAYMIEEADAPIIGDVTYRVDSYTYEPIYLAN